VIRATGSIGGSLVHLTPALRVYGVAASTVGDVPYGSYDAEIDTEGNFEMSNVPPGTYEVSVRGRLVVPSQQVTVVARARTAVDFDLPRDPVTLIIQVVGECGLVWLRPPGSSETLGMESCGAGTATFQGLRAGRYDICLENNDCHTIDVPPLREHTVRVEAHSS